MLDGLQLKSLFPFYSDYDTKSAVLHPCPPEPLIPKGTPEFCPCHFVLFLSCRQHADPPTVSSANNFARFIMIGVPFNCQGNGPLLFLWVEILTRFLN